MIVLEGQGLRLILFSFLGLPYEVCLFLPQSYT